MKELHARAASPVAADAERAMALLRAVESYPEWYPDGVREVTVLEREGDSQASRVRATLHVAHGPLVRDFRLTLAVREYEPSTIKLSRQPHHSGDQERFEVTWRVVQRGDVQIELALDANLSVPRLVPVGGVGESIARGFIDAASRALS